MATTKRMGWGALLNSVKDKKHKKEDEPTATQDAPPAKKLKSEVCLLFPLLILALVLIFRVDQN